MEFFRDIEPESHEKNCPAIDFLKIIKFFPIFQILTNTQNIIRPAFSNYIHTLVQPCSGGLKSEISAIFREIFSSKEWLKSTFL